MKSYKFIVKGRVQGVGYRYFCYVMAKKFELKGIVRNLDNGDVETIVQGEKTKVEIYRKYLEIGPMFSRVDKVLAEELEMDSFKNFEMIY